MTPILLVHLHVPGSPDSTILIDTPTTDEWQETWHPGPTLDAWTAARVVGHCVELELEVSRASFNPGRPARAYVPQCNVSVSAGSGWALVQDVNRPWPSSWPIKRGAWRRFGLYPSGRPNERMQAQILARGQLVASPPFQTWGPANMPLGSINASLQATLPTTWVEHYNGLRSALLTGANAGWYAEDTEDSPRGKPSGWIVWGPDDPGSPGGSGVYFSTGWQRCLEFARYALLACQPLHERMWLAYNKVTGQPITVDDYSSPSPQYSPGSHDANNNDLPENRGVLTQDPLPDPYDSSHRIRHDRYAIAAFELTGSPMCRRMVQNAAAQVRLQFTERGSGTAYGYTPRNLSNKMAAVQSNPHQGMFGTDGGRALGEPAFVRAAAKKFGVCDGNGDWEKMFLAMLDLAAPHHGVLQRNWESGNVWDGGPNDLAHSFEVPMLGIGALGTARQWALPIPRQIATAMRAVFCNPGILKPYYSFNLGPWNYMYVGAHGGAAYQAITAGQAPAGSPEGDATHAELGCAIGYSITGDQAFLDGMARVGLPASDWQEKLAQYASASGLDWSAFAYGQLLVKAAHGTGAP